MYYNISQPTIQRSRNSVQTGSQGEANPFGDEDHDNVHNEDTLRGVPEMPDEEAEATQRVGHYGEPLYNIINFSNFIRKLF